MQREPHYTTQDFFLAFLRGEEKGFDYFFREYFKALALFAYQLIHDEKEAEDIVQNCFEKLWKRRKLLSHIESIKSYLYTAVRYGCINFSNRKKTFTEPLSIHKIPDLTSDVESLVVASETIRQIHKVIEQLPPRMREVFKLYYLEGKSYKQIGEMLHTDPETVRRQRFTALKFVQNNIISS